MTRIVLVIMLLVVSLSGALVTAQEELTESYSDETISFRYPAGWFVELDDDGSAELSNVEFDEEDDKVSSGEVRVGFIPLSGFGSSEGFAIQEDDPKFIAGFFSGFFSILSMLPFLFQDIQPQIVVSEMEEVFVAEKVAYLTLIEVIADDGEDILMLSVEGGVFIIARAYTGEMDQWRDTILAIAEMVEFAQ